MRWHVVNLCKTHKGKTLNCARMIRWVVVNNIIKIKLYMYRDGAHGAFYDDKH